MAGKSTLLEALTNSGGENGTVSLTKKGVSILRCALSVPVLSLPLPFPFPCLCLSLPYPSPACLRTEEVKSRMELLQTASSTLKASERRVSKGDMSEEALSALAAVVAAFEAAICYKADQLVSNGHQCAARPGLRAQGRGAALPRGSRQMRIVLARLLLSGPNLMLLKVSTNHLSGRGGAALTGRLSGHAAAGEPRQGAAMRAASSSIAEVRHGRLELYK